MRGPGREAANKKEPAEEEEARPAGPRLSTKRQDGSARARDEPDGAGDFTRTATTW